ncbi:ParB-like nuclease domain protein [Arthrobacter phage Sonali]|uniref:ParB-like nuclease domain n=1 Tax=Arthrobacter phage Sonali TaxID=2510495 RepID=A0A411CQK4_9CAUD|nr:ParB-like partition protein [Arthrobacter phage Sonali]QAY16198.1 ParB-like nuclease domain protein [Arthrobacter phage Sonali]
MSKVDHQLAVEYVPIANLSTYPGNARLGDVDAITESMDENGIFAPIVVQRSTGYVIDGNHRYLAMQERGDELAPVIYVEVDDERAKRIVLAANRTNDLATYDEQLLVELLQDLPDLSGTGYSDDDLSDLLDAIKPPDSLEDLEDEFGEPEETDLWPKVIVQVPHDVKALWEAAMGADDLNHLPEHERLRTILQRAAQ